MSLEISNQLFDPRKEAMELAGSTPERPTVYGLNDHACGCDSDLLSKLARRIESDVCDVADNHDEYISEGPLAEIRWTHE